MIAPRSLRVAVVQASAADGGARETSRLVVEGLSARGHVVCEAGLHPRAAKRHRRQDRSIGWAGATRLFAPFRRPIRFVKSLAGLEPDAVVVFGRSGRLLAAFAARWIGCPTVVVDPMPHACDVNPAMRALEALLGCSGLFTSIVVDSAEVRSAYPWWCRSRIVCIERGFSGTTCGLPRERARETLGLPASVRLLGCAGRLVPRKQIDCVIRVLAISTELHLAVAGDGPDRSRLQSLVSALGVAERVHFLGELNRTEMGRLFAAIDGFVSPSRAETFGLSAAEAAQAGVQVVANRLPVLERVLSVDGEPCAAFADVSDPQALAAALDRALAGSDAFARMRLRGRRLAARFPADAMVGSYVRLVETLAEQCIPRAAASSAVLAQGIGAGLSGRS